MAYVEVRKDGRLILRRAVDVEEARRGCVVRLGEGVKVALRVGESSTAGPYEVRMIEGEPPETSDVPEVSSVPQPNGSDAPDLPPVTVDASPEADGGPVAVPEVEGYQITGRLGEGGMGVVWRAVQLSTKRQVALKLLPAAKFASGKSRARFEREVELSARLEHPNIARVYDSGLRRWVYFYAMELIDGVDLDVYVRENGLTHRQVLELMRTIAQAVQHAHQRGIIHRDLKPSNILVTDGGQPHVLDFGLAKAFQEDERGIEVSRAGDIAGAIPYMSPEQAAGKVDQLDTRTDVYSLGVILYELLTGRRPSDLSGSSLEILQRIAAGEIRRPREVSREIDRELEAVLLKALAADPNDRYASAGELAADIDNYLTGEPLTARAPTTIYFLRKRLRRYRVPAAVAATFLAALLGLAVFAYVRVTHERNRADREAEKATTEARNAGKEWAKAVVAKMNEEEQRKKAEEALRQAEGERQRADREADRARREAEANRRLLYIGWISQTVREYEAGNIIGARLHLHAAPAELRGWEWFHLRRGCNRAQRTLYGHTSRVWERAIVTDGKTIVSAGGWDNTARVWDVATGAEKLTLPHNSAVLSVALSHVGPGIVTGCDAGIVRQWDVRTGRLLRTSEKLGRPVSTVEVSPNGHMIAGGLNSGKIKLGTVGGDQWTDLDGHADMVVDLVFSPDSRTLVSASVDDSIRLWDITGDSGSRQLSAKAGNVLSVAFDTSGKRVVSSHQDGTIRRWDIETGENEILVRDRDDPGWMAALSPDDNLLAVTAGRVVEIWNARSGRLTQTLRGHQGNVNAVTFFPDGDHIVSGSDDGTLKIWDLTLDPVGRTIDAQQGLVDCVAVHPKGRRLASIGRSGTVRLWDFATLNLLSEASLSRQDWGWVAFNNAGGLLAASSGKDVVILDANDGSVRTTLRGHEDVVREVAFSPDDTKVVSGSRDGTLRLWDVDGGKALLTLKGHKAWVAPVAFSPDGERIASGSGDHTIGIWDASSGERITQLEGHKDQVGTLAFSPDGKLVASGGQYGEIKLWTTEPYKEIVTLLGHTRRVRSVVFSRDGQRILSGAEDGTIRLWDIVTRSTIFSRRLLNGSVMSVAFSPDGRSIICGCEDGRIRTLDSDPWGYDVEPRLISTDHATVMSVAFSPNGSTIASACRRGGVRLWDTTTLKETLDVRLSGRDWDCAAFSGDGGFVAAGNRKDVVILDSRNGKVMMTLRGHEDVVRAVAFSPDDRRLVSASNDDTVRIWDLAGGADPVVLKGHQGNVTSVVYAPDGNSIVSASDDRTLRVWDAITGAPLATLTGHTHWVASLAIDPHGKLVASASTDKTIGLWDLESRKRLRSLTGHRGPVQQVAFSPDGRCIVSGAEDRTIRLWSVSTGKEILSRGRFRDHIDAVAFSPDGRRLACGSRDGTIRIFDTDTWDDALDEDKDGPSRE